MFYFLLFHSETISDGERSQVLSVDWSVLSPEGVLTLLELTCRLLAKVCGYVGAIQCSICIESP